MRHTWSVPLARVAQGGWDGKDTWQTCLGEKRNIYKILAGKPEGKRHYKNLGITGNIILKEASKKLDQRGWTGVIWLSIGTNGRQM
jgi:hypothetical protein